MIKYANLDIFSSFLSLSETANPYAEAVKIVKGLGSVNEDSRIKELHVQLRREKESLEQLKAEIAKLERETKEMLLRINEDKYSGNALWLDAKCIARDFRKMTYEVLPYQKLAEHFLEPIKVHKDMKLVNDEPHRQPE